MADCKNLGVRLDADLHADLKVQAAKERRSIQDLATDAISQYLNRRKAIDKRKAS